MSDQAEPHPRFPHLFSPITINGVTLRNRVGVSAHYAGWWVTDGLPNEDFAAYIEERARGGMSLFIIGATATIFAGGPDYLLNTDDRIIPPYRMLAEAGHRHGAKVFAQLLHETERRSSGDEQNAEPVTKDFRVPVVPLTPPLRDAPNRTPEQLQALAETFGVAAARVKNAGLDGVELHAHQRLLFNQFLSPRYNRRTDEYGGPLENRMRFMVQTLQAMRQAVGADFPLGVRICIDDQVEGGKTIEDSLDMVRRLTAFNLVDYISCTVGYVFHTGPMARPSGEWLSFVGRIKQATNLPVLHAGGITTPDTAEQALAEGKLDFVFMTRTHIADPHFVSKVREGRLDDIRFCTRCLQSCIGDMEHMSCVYNPVTSRERQWAKLHRAKERKKVVVVGAGPAGMEAALTAHGRGHEVVVLEQSERVGGQVHLAATAPLRANLIRIARFYQRQAAKGLFDVQLNTEVGVEEIVALAPDAVVVATGSVPVESALPGSDHVWNTHDALTHEEVWKCRRVVVLDRYGCMEALAVADFLSSQGVTVQFLTPFSEVVPYIESLTRSEMLRQIEQRNITFHLGDEVVAWESGEVWVRNTRNAVERTVSNIDRIVIAAGARPVNGLALALRNRVGEVHTIGDANLPRTIAEATLQGGSIGRIL